MAKKTQEATKTSTNGTGIPLDLTGLRKAALVLRAVNHKLRQDMMDLIDENDKMTVTDLFVKMRIEQSVASQHLAILRRARVVKTERDGKFIFYSVDKNRIEQISSLSVELSA